MNSKNNNNTCPSSAYKKMALKIIVTKISIYMYTSKVIGKGIKSKKLNKFNKIMNKFPWADKLHYSHHKNLY